MLGSSLPLALLGLGAVQALPTKTTVEERTPQIFGPPTTSLTPGDGPNPPSINLPPWLRPGAGGSGAPPVCDWSRSGAMCIFFPAPSGGSSNGGSSGSSNGGGSSFGDGGSDDGEGAESNNKRMARRQHLPPDRDQGFKDYLARLERRVEYLKNKRDKTPEEWDEMRSLEDRIYDLSGVTEIYAPPGSSSTFTPGKARRDDGGPAEFRLPADGYQSYKNLVAQLEQRLEQLQNKPDKTDLDLTEIEGLRFALRRLAGISEINAPPGTTTTFTPGK